MRNRIDEIAKTLAREDLSRREAIRKIGGGFVGAALAALGLGTLGKTTALAQSAPAHKNARALKRVRAVLSHCWHFDLPLSTDLNWFWNQVGVGVPPNAHDACTCWSRSTAGQGRCTQDLAYDVCMILSGNAPPAHPPTSYAGGPHSDFIPDCFY